MFPVLVAFLALLGPPGGVPAAAARSDASCATDTWSNRFGWDAFLGYVNASIVFHDELIVGGNFTAAPGVVAHDIAAWNGHAWRPLDAGLHVSPGRFALYRGDLVVAGSDSRQPTGPFRDSIQRWDGREWRSLDGGPGAQVLAVCPFKDLLVVAIDTPASGPAPTSPFRAWDGSRWQVMDSTATGAGRALVAYQGELLGMLGSWNATGDRYVDRFVRWDGHHWLPVTGELARGVFRPVAAIGDTLFANRKFGPGPDARLSAWDGHAWQDLTDPNGWDIPVVSTWRSEVVVSGPMTIIGHAMLHRVAVRRNGAWTYLGGVTEATQVYSLTEYQGALFGCGNFFGYGAGERGGVARWEDDHWALLGGGARNGLRGYVTEMVVYSGSVVILGDIASAGDLDASNLAAWSGDHWEVPGPGLPNSFIPNEYHRGLAAAGVFDGELYAGGEFRLPDTPTYRHLARWSGARWSPLPSDPGGTVEALLGYGGRLVAGGYFETPESPRIGVRGWDGRSWRTIGVELSDPVTALGTHDGALVAAAAQGDRSTRLYVLAGDHWRSLPGQFDGPITRIMDYAGQLVVGGSFTTVSGRACRGIALLDREDWRAPGGGVDGAVADLLPLDGCLVAAGTFTHAGGIEARHVAFWNGVTWAAAGSGTDGAITSLALLGGQLYAGGGFTSAGGFVSPGFARLDRPGYLQPRPPLTLRASPNPFRAAVDLDFELADQASPVITIYDPQGRLVRRLGGVPAEAGPRRLAWDGRTMGGAPAPPGVYLVCLRVDARDATVKIARLP